MPSIDNQHVSEVQLCTVSGYWRLLNNEPIRGKFFITPLVSTTPGASGGSIYSAGEMMIESDVDGAFQVSLPPGRYAVRMREQSFTIIVPAAARANFADLVQSTLL